MSKINQKQVSKGNIKKILLIITFIGIFMPWANINSKASVDTTDRTEVIKAFPVNAAADPTAFISVWDTLKISTGSSAANQIKLPVMDRGTYNFFVDWGDSTTNTFTNANYTEAIHTYSVGSVYVVTITGTFIGWQFYLSRDQVKLLDIQQWGTLQLGDSLGHFTDCHNLKLTATDNLNLTGTTSLNGMFAGCYNLGSSGNMNGWDVSNVINMASMFYEAATFNQPLGDWDVSSVTEMDFMFSGADAFNQPIGDWDVSNVISMFYMFSRAGVFNQPIMDWDVSSVLGMDYMFYDADAFNQPIGDWDVSSVLRMDYMFNDADTFNQPLGNWDVSIVYTMDFMFASADTFNQPLGNWDVSSVIQMKSMFAGVSLSPENYDHLLLGWSQLSLQNDVVFDAGNSQYTSAGEEARENIIDTFNWEIQDGGELKLTFLDGNGDFRLPSYPFESIAAFGLFAIVWIAQKRKYRI